MILLRTFSWKMTHFYPPGKNFPISGKNFPGKFSRILSNFDKFWQTCVSVKEDTVCTFFVEFSKIWKKSVKNMYYRLYIANLPPVGGSKFCPTFFDKICQKLFFRKIFPENFSGFCPILTNFDKFWQILTNSQKMCVSVKEDTACTFFVDFLQCLKNFVKNS